MPAVLSFDRTNKVIIVPDAETEIAIQEIHDQSRQYENELTSLDLDSLVTAGGKDDLGGGRYTGITLTLINDWRLQFEARSSWTNCYVRGGNLVAINSYGNDPIKPSAYVNVIIAQSTAPSLISIGDVADAVWDEMISEHTNSGSLGALVDFISNIEGGRWRVIGNQMIFYKPDNETEVARFDLKDKDGQPTESSVYDRQRV